MKTINPFQTNNGENALRVVVDLNKKCVLYWFKITLDFLFSRFFLLTHYKDVKDKDKTNYSKLMQNELGYAIMLLFPFFLPPIINYLELLKKNN